MRKKDFDLLERNGYTVTCEDPLELELYGKGPDAEPIGTATGVMAKEILERLQSLTGKDFELGEMVHHPSDVCPFEVVGIREDELEIKGDFSGGTHNVSQVSWVPVSEIRKQSGWEMDETDQNGLSYYGSEH